MPETNEDNSSKLSLSAAILAPLNAIFEAQVHAARSFLSFILQMGFRHKYSEEEKRRLRESSETDPKILERLKEEEKAKDRIDELRKKRENATGGLSDLEESELKRLLFKWDDIYSQEFSYFDDNGDEQVVSIPNIALIPVKPLAIDDAHIHFEMQVDQKYEDYSTIRRSEKADVERPWFLIKPKRIQGTIVPKGESNTRAGISIEISIKSTEMPFGLNRLLTTMTESSKIFPKPRKDDDKGNQEPANNADTN